MRGVAEALGDKGFEVSNQGRVILDVSGEAAEVMVCVFKTGVGPYVTLHVAQQSQYVFGLLYTRISEEGVLESWGWDYSASQRKEFWPMALLGCINSLKAESGAQRKMGNELLCGWVDAAFAARWFAQCAEAKEPPGFAIKAALFCSGIQSAGAAIEGLVGSGEEML